MVLARRPLVPSSSEISLSVDPAGARARLAGRRRSADSFHLTPARGLSSRGGRLTACRARRASASSGAGFPSLGINFVSASYRSRCSSLPGGRIRPSAPVPFAMLEIKAVRGPAHLAARKDSAITSAEQDRQRPSGNSGLDRQRQAGGRSGTPLLALPARWSSLLTGCIADPGRQHGLQCSTPGRGPRRRGTATSAPLETTQSSNKAPGVLDRPEQRQHVFLYREFRDVPGTGKPGHRALRAMMSRQAARPGFLHAVAEPQEAGHVHLGQERHHG